MRRVLIISIVLFLMFSVTAGAQSTEKKNKLEPLPRDLEVQLALSALPPHLRDNATVYVLNPDKGFEVARKGANGFHAFVGRIGDDTFRGTWPFKEYRDDILYPISFDEAGVATNMRIFFDAAEMQAKGTPPQELKTTMRERLRTSYYKTPDRAGVSYMLAPILRTYVNPDGADTVVTSNIPHVMYYAPNVTNQEMGGGMPSPEDFGYYVEHGRWPKTPYPFVILQGSHGYMIQFRGFTERDAITQGYEEMLARLCKIKDAWCLLH